MKLLGKILLILLITVGGHLGYHIAQKPTNIFPYPYILDKTEINDLKAASEANVLIIGDRMALNLHEVMQNLTRQASPGFSEPLEIYNWGKKNEGLHRSLKKLQTLKKIPELVIYHGASEEYFEKKGGVEEKENFNKNLKGNNV